MVAAMDVVGVARAVGVTLHHPSLRPQVRAAG